MPLSPPQTDALLRLTLALWLGLLLVVHAVLACLRARPRGLTPAREQKIASLLHLLEIQIGALALVLSVEGGWGRTVCVFVMWAAAIAQFGVLRARMQALLDRAPYPNTDASFSGRDRFMALRRQCLRVDAAKLALGCLVLMLRP